MSETWDELALVATLDGREQVPVNRASLLRLLDSEAELRRGAEDILAVSLKLGESIENWKQWTSDVVRLLEGAKLTAASYAVMPAFLELCEVVQSGLGERVAEALKNETNN